jgi:hypothetical protein
LWIAFTECEQREVPVRIWSGIHICVEEDHVLMFWLMFRLMFRLIFRLIFSGSGHDVLKSGVASNRRAGV